MELWKPIRNFEMYEISNMGSIRKKSGQVIAQHKDARGYMRARLNGNKYSVHRMVAKAFVPNIEGKSQVIHRDGNKLNNWHDNLIWLSVEEFMALPMNEICGRKENAFMKRKRPVTCYTLEGSIIDTYPSIQAAARATGSTAPSIHRVLSGNLKKHNKRLWRYADVEASV